MAKKASRPEPTITQGLSPLRSDCPHCGRLLWADYANRRTVATPDGLTRLRLTIRRCRNADCPAYHRPYRPEAAGPGTGAEGHHDTVKRDGAKLFAGKRSRCAVRALTKRRRDAPVRGKGL